MSSGWAAMAKRSRSIVPPAGSDCRVGGAVLSVSGKVEQSSGRRKKERTDKSVCPTGMCYGFWIEDDGKEYKDRGNGAGARGSCDGGCETVGAGGGFAAGGRWGGCCHSLPDVAGGGGERRRGDRKIGAAGDGDCGGSGERCGNQAAV